jgi:hypothetical protein
MLANLKENEKFIAAFRLNIDRLRFQKVSYFANKFMFYATYSGVVYIIYVRRSFVNFAVT